MDNDLDLKFLAIGDSGVGKTCLLNRYVEGNYNEKLAPTVGIDIRDKTLLYKSNKTNKSYNIHLQLWDTAGQERFRSLTASFFRDAIGFLLVFDLSNETSFISVRNWITEIQANAYSENVDMILVGNKCDLESQRIISKARALEFAAQNHVDYIETSALQNINVGESIELLLDSVMDRLEQNHTLNKPKQSTLKPSSTDQITQQMLENHTQKKPNVSYCCSY
ncbi:unnamed protein product [Adineta steineri]|uniref:Uncharacterized protein n=1 Tax=Adineta steineri TaxID=433720 RepID=A0A813MZB7_9BILA|nr:unnamed protein product [Adineta steineri]CAF3831577.1 unnamed protein product [Adineta steineri]